MHRWHVQGRTFIHMQAPVTNATNNTTKGAWEYAVPNGQYKVEVGYGDANLGRRRREPHAQRRGRQLRQERPELARRHGVQLRRQPACAWPPAGSTVTDGKLTVDAIGGTNTKLAWVTIDSVPVAGLTATVQSADLDRARLGRRRRRHRLQGVAQRGPARAEQPDDRSRSPCSAAPTSSEFTDTTAVKGVLYHYSVGTSATAAAINGTVVQAMSDDADAPAADAAAEGQLPGPRPAPRPPATSPTSAAATATPAASAGSHPGTQVPLSLVGNGRTRTIDATAARAARTR